MESEITRFEFYLHEEDFTFCWASDLMRLLGYEEMKDFHKVLDRVTKTLMQIGISHYENIVQCERIVDGKKERDMKMTRFACMLAAMNGDPKKKEVAAAQAFFAALGERIDLLIRNPAEFERLVIREEVKEGNKALSATAKGAALEDYARFHNAGYLGLYNMPIGALLKRRGLDKGKFYDTMSRTELSANLFRITMTDERIKKDGITGQGNLERAHHDVGQQVRNLVISNVGMPPEQLPQERRLPDIGKELKSGYKRMLKQEGNTKKNNP